VNVVCGGLLLAVVIPAVWVAEQWAERQSHKLMDRMIWREPVESWNGNSGFLPSPTRTDEPQKDGDHRF
jgi:hypothetical protein